MIAQDQIPAHWPTHTHSSAFWEALGRAVGTFGFLEETLGRAIFALSGTRRYPPEEIDGQHEKWVKKLEKAISDPLGPLIVSFETELRDHPDIVAVDIGRLVADLNALLPIRNAICHASWRAPSPEGFSTPLFVSKKLMIFETPIDVQYLTHVQTGTVDLILTIIGTVTSLGVQFPGSSGPGTPIWT